MDGRGRWLDNVVIERLWRSLKYENVHPHAYETVLEAHEGIGKWIDFTTGKGRKQPGRIAPRLLL